MATTLPKITKFSLFAYGSKSRHITFRYRMPSCYLGGLGKMADEEGTLFVSIPRRLDANLAPKGYHLVHTFTPHWISRWQGIPAREYTVRKEEAAGRILERLEQIFQSINTELYYLGVGTPLTPRRFLGREDGTYGAIPRQILWGLLRMPFNRTAIPGLYCVGDSTFPGQGLNAVAFSGFDCAHKIGVDLGLDKMG